MTLFSLLLVQQSFFTIKTVESCFLSWTLSKQLIIVSLPIFMGELTSHTDPEHYVSEGGTQGGGSAQFEGSLLALVKDARKLGFHVPHQAMCVSPSL